MNIFSTVFMDALLGGRLVQHIINGFLGSLSWSEIIHGLLQLVRAVLSGPRQSSG